MSGTDTLNPGPDTSLVADMQIFLVRQGVKIITETEEIASPIEYVEDANLSFGSTAIRQAGSPGRKLVTYQLQLENNQEVARAKIQEVITQQPVTRIVARGPQGSFGQALARLRNCESGGNYANKSNSRYRGAYQYDYATWNNYGGFYDPADAPPPLQDEKATETYRRRGWQPWPACSQKLGLQDIYR